MLDLAIMPLAHLPHLHLSITMLAISIILLPLNTHLPSSFSSITAYSFPILFFPSPTVLPFTSITPLSSAEASFIFHPQQHIFSSGFTKHLVKNFPSPCSNLRGLLVPPLQYFYHALPDVKGTCEQVMSSISLQAF